jgi:hypothetical protein
MISLRSFVTLTTVVATAFVFAACSDNSTSPLNSGLHPGDADLKSSKSSSKTITGDIDARVLLDKAGYAILEVHAGAFNDATNTATPKGTFSALTYTVKDAGNRNKTIVTHTVSFSKSVSSYFYHLNLCTSQGDDDDDDDGSSHYSSCNSHWGSQYVLTVTANLKGIGTDGKSTGTGSATATVLNLPDIDLSQQQLFVVSAAGTQTPATSVNPVTPTTFSVPFPNNKPIGGVANAVGAQGVVCVVTVDGFPQLPLPNGVYNKYLNPNAFGYVGSAVQNINAGATGSCDFTLSLPAGTHKIVVTAGSLYPGDYDFSNNSTQSFTVNSAVSGPADVAVGLLTADAGGTAGNVNLQSAAITAGQTGIKLYVWASLNAGAPPSGPVACTVTITPPTGAAVVLTGSIALSAASPIAACQVSLPASASYTFPVAGQYTAVGSVSAAGDPNAANNTSAPVTVTVSAAAPSAIVTVGSLSFTDAAEAITGQRFQPSANPAADTVHSRDPVTYTATINVGSLQNTASVPTITCSATVDGVAVTTGWVNQTITGATEGSTPTCSFNKTIVDASNTLHPHTIAFSVSTGTFTNYAATPATTLSGSINAVQRVDVSVAPLQVLVSGVWTDLSAAGIKQSTTDTVRFIATNSSPVATAINCGAISPAVVGDAAAVAQLTPTLITTQQPITLNANNGTAICQYQVTAPEQLGLISINLVAGVTTAAGQPLDPNPANNFGAGVFTIKSNGQFTTFPPAGASQKIGAYQGWYSHDPLTGALDSLSQQGVDVKDLALLVIPTQNVLGSFSLSGTVTSGTSDQIAFGTGRAGTTSAPITLPRSVGGVRSCVPLQSSNLPMPNAVEPGLSFSAIICAEDAPGQAGFQQIVITYSQSISHPITAAELPVLFANHVTVKIALNFTLTGSTTSDAVSGTITIPVKPIGCTASSGDADAPLLCSNNFGAFTLTTP